MPGSSVIRALGRLERMLRGKGLTRIPGLHAVAGLGRERVDRFLASRIPVSTGEFDLFMPREVAANYRQGPYEPLTQRSFVESLRPGMTMVDIGAHVGFVTVLSARLVGPSGRVHAFEPSGDNLAYLRRNVALNGHGNVTVHAAAVGSESCMREFHLAESSDSNGFYAHPLTGTVRTVRVEQKALDDVITGPVDAVKIDVEGAETEVLDGMRRLLRENPRMTVWAEWNPACMRNAGYDPLELPRRLRELGFGLTVLDDLHGGTPSLEETMAQVRDGGTPEFWYVNLWGRRE